MKTTLEIADRKAKATASALGIPLREFVTQAVEEKLSQGSRAAASHGWSVPANWPIFMKRRRESRRSSTRISNRSSLRTGLDPRC